LIDRTTIFNSYQYSDWTRQYYQQIPKDVIADGLIYSGRWESFLIKLGKVITAMTGYENFHLDFQDRDHAQKYWPEKRLRLLINCLAHPQILNKFLYKGQMISLNDHHLGNFLLNNFKKSFLEKDPRDSFFLQMLFLGKVIYNQAYPLEFQKSTFTHIKNFQGTIHFLRKDLIQAVEELDFDFASLSNVASYFDIQNKLKFEEALFGILTKQGSRQIILRSFLRPDPIKLEKLKSYLDKERSLIAEQQDSTLLYKFQILKKI
jgi:S-adenosylmethionine:diacylglycerol 3-amino-3-carboxypropyl transferase